MGLLLLNKTKCLLHCVSNRRHSINIFPTLSSSVTSHPFLSLEEFIISLHSFLVKLDCVALMFWVLDEPKATLDKGCILINKPESICKIGVSTIKNVMKGMTPNSVGKAARKMIAMAGTGHGVTSPLKTPGLGRGDGERE